MPHQRVACDDNTGAICCDASLTTTPETSHAASDAGRQNDRNEATRDEAKRYEDNEHRKAARQFFAKHGYRPLTEGQSNAVHLVGIVKPRQQ